MTTRADFNADDWAAVTEAPMLTAAAVVKADKGGTLRESMSLARAYAEARQAQHTELLEALVASPPSIDPASLQGVGDVTDHALTRLRGALRIVDGVATLEEAEDYRAFVRSLGETVAKAHKEGGVLGFGGKEIGPGEQELLDRISEALAHAQ